MYTIQHRTAPVSQDTKIDSRRNKKLIKRDNYWSRGEKAAQDFGFIVAAVAALDINSTKNLLFTVGFHWWWYFFWCAKHFSCFSLLVW